MNTLLSERDLDALSEPARAKAFEFLGLLRESGYPEQLALGLALRGAREAEAGSRERSHFGMLDTSLPVPTDGHADLHRARHNEVMMTTKTVPTCSILAAGALLGAASGLSCQPAEAKSADEAAGGGSSLAMAAPPAPANPHAKDEQAAHTRADAWLALIDQQQFEQSWDAAAPLFQSSVKKEKWGDAVRAARAPLGALSSRRFNATEYKASLPGAPAGQYVVVYYDTGFARKQSASEIVTLMKSDSDWNVAGYFVR